MCRQVITEGDVVGRSEEFEAAVKAEDRAALAEFCRAKAAAAPEEEAETWNFMGLLFQEDSRRCVSVDQLMWL
jgi:protein transport protein SEC31